MPDAVGGRVLIFAPIGRDGPASAEVLKRVGLASKVCMNLSDLIDEVEVGAAAVFIAEEALFGTDTSVLGAWVQAQPPWSDLPFIVLTSRQEQPAVSAWRKSLVATLRNVSLLERPIQPITLGSALQAAVRARRRQYELRDLLEERNRAAEALESTVVARTTELEAANRALRSQIAERERIEETLRHVQKMEAIGQLTGGVAHDFNNLLMVITGGLDILDRQKHESRRQQIMDGMRQAAQRGARLTRQLLAFSRRQSLTPEAVDLVHQIGGMREILDRSLRGDVQMHFEFAEDLWPVEADPGELELVILNLAVNARDAMPDGGTIIIRAENAPGLQDDVLVGDFVRITVTDTGTGIAPELRERVFEPFFTTKEVGKGSGLGLPQVYGFAAQSGGAVQIESDMGRGTRVMLMLPRSERNPKAPVPRNDEPDGADAGSDRLLSVLLVEDDSNVGVLVSEMLNQLGFEVTHAQSADAALVAVSDGRRVDMVFSDVMMPGGMNGVDMARELHKRRPGLPILLTSGNAEAVRHIAETEGIDILDKPYTITALAKAIDVTLSGRKPA